MNLRALWLRARYARLLLSARRRVAAGKYEAARSDVGRIFDLYEARGVEVPISADIMRALIAWNLADYGATAVYVRRAADKLGRRLTTEMCSERRHELHYLRAYCWTLLYYSEASGAAVRWEHFTDLVPVCHVDLSKVSRTTRETFPVDEEVFAPAQPQ